jgi:hypothetical protein
MLVYFLKKLCRLNFQDSSKGLLIAAFTMRVSTPEEAMEELSRRKRKRSLSAVDTFSDGKSRLSRPKQQSLT